MILLLLDLSTGLRYCRLFYSVFRLSDRFVLNGKALAWFESYLKRRKNYVQVEYSKSTTRTSMWSSSGVGLGPQLYVLYTAPVADIIKSHRVRSFETIWIRISDPRSLVVYQMNRESTLDKDSSVHLIYHDPSDLGSLILIRIIPKERTHNLQYHFYVDDTQL